ncbi:MAG: HD-GYP domain-containing protein [Gammaproteobacteria bacterium]
MHELKKINIDQLRLGMFIAGFCGSWMEHPFWNTRFRLASSADLEAIRNSPIAEIWIDPARGLDVDDSAAETRAARSARIEAELSAIVAQHPALPATRTLAAELPLAAALCREGARVVDALFAAARGGEVLDTGALPALVDAITASVARHPLALASLARIKGTHDYDSRHAIAVSAWMGALACALGASAEEVHEAALAGLVHDIGKARVPRTVIDKAGKLSEAEFALVRTHPEAGHALLAAAGGIGTAALDVCLHHPEKLDGSGYPHGLRGEAIGRYARMGAVCDVYDAVTSERVYMRGWDPATALRRMADWADGHFDTTVFGAFVGITGLYPPGALVRLDSGLLAVVCDTASGAATQPTVRTVYCTRRDAPVSPATLDLATGSACIVAREDPAAWNLERLDAVWAGEDTLAVLHGH